MPDDHRPGIAQLTATELDRCASQLARCLKALDTSAPIRADVQHELAGVRAEQVLPVTEDSDEGGAGDADVGVR